jgi:alanine-glyoxylate transaminase/serine-glyoxylate transaminase/serine-pyruvate transaminase
MVDDWRAPLLYATSDPADLSVLEANATPGTSHVSPAFVPVFGDCIRMLRKVLYTKDGQPFLIAGSGTMGWDAAGANLIEPGENAVSSG